MNVAKWPLPPALLFVEPAVLIAVGDGIGFLPKYCSWSHRWLACWCEPCLQADGGNSAANRQSWPSSGRDSAVHSAVYSRRPGPACVATAAARCQETAAGAP